MATARRAVTISRLVVRADRSAFAFILAAVLVEMVFFIVLGPLLPHYASTLHMSKLGAGVLSASYAAGCGLAAIPVGAFEITDTGTRFIPLTEKRKLIAVGMIGLCLGLLCAKRK